ncbi:MAG: GPP34 family phosphoprotein [Actinobacteria bacterium]|nr:GPP34 family phosphoprotein [Actinomycetota bacterium]
MSPAVATDLLLLARNPAGGTLRHRVALERALRSALFVDLALAGALLDTGRAPAVAGFGPTGDRILDAVRATVDARPDVMWPRWYRHVSEDRVELTKELIRSGRWIEQRSTGRVSYVDADTDATLRLGLSIERVAQRRMAPRDSHEAVLAILTVICGAISGPPRPREFRRELLPLLDTVGPLGDPTRRTVQVALATGAQAVKRRRRVFG